MVLKDQYLLHEAYKLGDTDELGLLANSTHPENIPNGATVYVNDLSNPTAINGYRVGNVWYNSSGIEIENPNLIASPNGIAPYLINPRRIKYKSFRGLQTSNSSNATYFFLFPNI